MMMNPEIKAKWVAALRSGEYKQTQHQLKAGNEHCCLGVLCEISKAETGFTIGENLDQTGGCECLSDTVQEWAGLSCGAGDEVTIEGYLKNLSEHNDDGHTFAEIADAIEAQL